MVGKAWSRGWLLAGAAAVLLGSEARGDGAALEGYQDYNRFQATMRGLGQSKLAALRSLATTAGGREVLLLEVGKGDRHEKPAILVLGSVHAPQAVASELVVRVARHLVENAPRDAAWGAILDRVTFYCIPRPTPDASEAQFERPAAEREGNKRVLSAGRLADEDDGGPADLNGDGLITMMRLADGGGTWIPHPSDPRVMIQADPQRGEQGRYKLLVEGRGSDRTGEFRVGPPPGVAFNRNFPFRYAPFQPQVGPYPVSEIETRAVADFAFQRTNIAVVVTVAPEDNLVQMWKPDAAAEAKPLKTTLLAADAAVYQQAGKFYREILGRQDHPDSSAGQGAFSSWAYFHYGRWSFAARGWWIPSVESGEKAAKEKPGGATAEAPAAKGEPGKNPAAKNPASRSAGEKPAGEDRRGSDELNALRWMQRESIDGFVPWTRIDHPDLPHRTVEVGGFKPWIRHNPPARELDALGEKHARFVRRLAEQLPRVAIDRAEAQSLGRGLYRVTAAVVNQGAWPTMSRMGALSHELQRLQVELELKPGVTLVTGVGRQEVPPLNGHGGRSEHVWLVRVGPVQAASPASSPAAKSAVLSGEERSIELSLTVWCPSVGRQQSAVRLAPAKGQEKQP